MLLKALCGMMRGPGSWAVGCFLVENKEFLNVITLSGGFRLFEGSSVECHREGKEAKNDVLLCIRHCVGYFLFYPSEVWNGPRQYSLCRCDWIFRVAVLFQVIFVSGEGSTCPLPLFFCIF